MIRLSTFFFLLCSTGVVSAYIEPSTTTLQCYLEVAVETPEGRDTFVAIDKPCGVYTHDPKIGTIGSALSEDFTWIVNGDGKNDYFFYLYKDAIFEGRVLWSASWNGDPASTHAQNNLGEDFKLYQLTNSGACLQNKEALICLHEVGKTPERIKPFKEGWKAWVLNY